MHIRVMGYVHEPHAQNEQLFELKPASQIFRLLHVQESSFIILLCLSLTDLKGSSEDKHTLKVQFPYPPTFR